MDKPRLLAALASAAGLGLLLSSCVPDRIEDAAPVTGLYASAEGVAIGLVRSVDPGAAAVEVCIAETVKGPPLGETLTLRAPADLAARLAPAMPVLVFVGAEGGGGATALVHAADGWWEAERTAPASPPGWRILRPRPPGFSFPGRTAALVLLLDELKAGRPTMLNAAEANVFRGGAGVRAWLPVRRPTFLAAADVNQDGRPDLVVGSAAGVRLYLASGDTYRDATDAWGLKGARGWGAVFGDAGGDGRPDLLLGRTLWTHTGRRFVRAADLPLPEEADWLAAALDDVTGDGRADAVVLRAGGDLAVARNPGGARQAWTALPARSLWTGGKRPAAAAFSRDWGDDGGLYVLVVRPDGVTRYAADPAGAPPADDVRLTGQRLADLHPALAEGRAAVFAALALDLDGNGRRDLLILGEGGGVGLVNRGFGAFLVNPAAGAALAARGGAKVPFDLGRGAMLAAADVHGDRFDEALVLTPDGRLCEVSNPPFAARP